MQPMASKIIIAIAKTLSIISKTGNISQKYTLII